MYSCSCLVGLKFLARFVSNLGEIFGARRILVFNLRKLLTRNQNFFSLGELKTPPGLFLVYERRAKVLKKCYVEAMLVKSLKTIMDE